MTKKKRRRLCIAAMLALGITLLLPVRTVQAYEKKTIYNSPYVSFSPDGKAWTTCAGEKGYRWYEENTVVFTGMKSSLRKPVAGEHYYSVSRMGEVPIGAWKVCWRRAQCIHNAYGRKQGWHGLRFGTAKCQGYYNSGWKPVCADCGEWIETWNIYMSREAAATIHYMELGSEEAPETYYYLCPHCTNLEQGVTFPAHRCKKISPNQYKVIYDANADPGSCVGFMGESYHMYDNAEVYEGGEVTPVTHLTKNNYTRIGYLFTGWNTAPDGSGDSYADEAEICNLATADHRDRTTWTDRDNGSVTLYAQWTPCESTLCIDAGGGKYLGKNILEITDVYGKKYRLHTEEIQPPAGSTLTFETNGGTAVPSIRGTQHFEEWTRVLPFLGELDGNVYTYCATEGNRDTVKALYRRDCVTLPGTVREGWSFGGWYYDKAFTMPAGAAGEEIIPSADSTLYAQWVDLKLESADNYKANGGKGAVDLSWSQTDQKNKTYLLFQKKENGTWTRINSAEDISSMTQVAITENYSGSAEEYTIPYTGLYTLTAEGAQGQDFESCTGGYGGRVSGTFWLQKGEKITCFPGGQDGGNGGGTASAYGNGGGMTSVTSDRKGILLIAGGGGGASPAGDGKSGGSAESVREESSGEDGMAGGGAGYRGGSAGEKIVHSHTNQCYREAAYTPALGSWEHYVTGHDDYCETYTATRAYSHTKDDDPYHIIRAGWSRYYWDEGNRWNTRGYPGINTNGNTKLNISVYADSWGSSCNFSLNKSQYTILNQDGKVILSGSFRDAVYSMSGSSSSAWENSDGSWGGAPGGSKFAGTFHFTLPEGTTKIFVDLKFSHDCSDAWLTSEITGLSFSGGRMLTCGYTEGQVLSSKPAYGGSNYVNTAYARMYESESGVHRGNGSIQIQSEAIGYQEECHMEGVVATDLAAPDRIPAEMTMEALDHKRVQIAWQQPSDNGTRYYHKAESYLTGSTKRLCTSNITGNLLVSGIAGYYFTIDDAADTKVGAQNAKYTEKTAIELTANGKTQYFHVAAVDVAGNVGPTTHFSMKDTDVKWKIYTGPLEIESGDNVYPAPEAKSWYVRADGKTPFTLKNNASLDGDACEEYQPNENIYETRSEDGTVARNIIHTPSGEIRKGNIRTDASGLSYTTEGVAVLQQYPYSYTVRSNLCRELTGVQKFTIDAAYSGQRIQAIPIAEADAGDTKVYSTHALDEKNKITLVADGEAPTIYGLDLLEDRKLIDRREGEVTVTVTASDAVSGVKEFYVRIQNTDNTVAKTFVPDDTGSIRIVITEDDAMFSGNFTVMAYAADYVGNETEITKGTTEFGLEADVMRIREPQGTTFRCGESGILTFTVWGYADLVEVIFPEEMTRQNPELNRVYDYRDQPGYRITESIQFMVPLYTPENEQLPITVLAYKGDKKLEDHPQISVIGVKGSVLEDLRTRLR